MDVIGYYYARRVGDTEEYKHLLPLGSMQNKPLPCFLRRRCQYDHAHYRDS